MSASDDAVHNARTSSNPHSRIAALGVLTGALYIVNYFVQRALFHGAPLAPAAGGPMPPSGSLRLLGQAGGYSLATIGLFAAYREVLAMCSRGELARGSARTLALAVPCVVSLALTFGRPWVSQDVFSYMAHGILGVLPGNNPFLLPAEAATGTDYGPALGAYGWHGQIGITPYGIVWTWLETAVMGIAGDRLALALVLLKSIVTAASLGTAFFIWSFLGRVRPAAQLLGTLAYLWNPMILAEFPGEGHNDAVILFFVAASLAACAAGRATSSMVAQMLGILTKYVSLMFCPAQLVFLWRTRRSAAALGLAIILAVAVTGALAAGLYAHLWAGPHTFDGLLKRGAPISSAAPFGAVNWVLRRSPLAAHAGPLTVACVTLPLLAFVAWTSLRVRDAAGLARACAWISLGYVLVSSPDYWPWYACMPVALIIAADTERLLWLAMLMSLTARLCAPLDLIRDHGYLGMVAAKGALPGFGATLPLVVLLAWLYRRRRGAASLFA